MKMILWLVSVEDSNGIHRNLCVAKSKTKARKLAKGHGFKEVIFICETEFFEEEKLIIYF